MEIATVLSVVQTIIFWIQTVDHLKATFSFSQFRDEFERLETTARYIQSVLKDADASRVSLSHQQTIYIQDLKDAIYDADDILDEFSTLVKQRKAVVETPRHKLSDKVRSFLSRFSLRNHNLSQKVVNINKKLNEISKKLKNFSFKVDNNNVSRRPGRCESYTGGSEDDIIFGRDKDLEKVVGMLLDSTEDVNQPNTVSSLAIVGMEGIGKSKFTELVYNDPRVTSAFQLKSWTCIADHHQDQWNLTEVLNKIVKELPGANKMAHIDPKQIKELLGGKKYLLVLDDVWTESYDRWRSIEKFLRVGASGSRIVVTTRSEKTAQIVGGDRVHELQGLLEVDSWRMFESIAFPPNQLENLDDDELVKLWKEIVKKCKNVPQSIRVVASHLRSQPKDKWVEQLRKKKLDNISESLSYDQLDFPLKSCFSYFAIFPKDFLIDKEMLIGQWMAQGYISCDSVGQEYFSTLLQRCFFYYREEDEWGDVRRFKIHDLFHDIAEQQAGKDICRLNSGSLNEGNNKVRHLSLLNGFCPEKTFDKSRITRIRTCIQVHEQCGQTSSDQFLERNSLANWTCLRSLDLSRLSVETLPESISELLHLRWLNLSWCEKLNTLCDSITKLVNLQTLDLSNCFSLRKLPKDVSKLLELSTLNLMNCNKLSHMPSGLGSLTNLHTLGLFVVGQKSSKMKQCFDGLEDLRSMSNLKGFLEVRIGIHDIADYVKKDHGERGYLSNKERLKVIHFKFTGREYQNFEYNKHDIANANIKREQALLEKMMQPHHDLKGLLLEGYIGKVLPKWLRKEDNSSLVHLHRLVSLHISDCVMLQSLTPVEELRQLKVLKHKNLPSVEYVLNVELETLELGKGLSLFPCLEELDIRDLPRLKGWLPRSGSGVQNKHLLLSIPIPYFAKLKNNRISIADCPLWQSFPICSSPEHESVESHPNSTMHSIIETIFIAISRLLCC